MKAKIVRKDGYKCAPNGHSVVSFPYGAEVEGRVAKWAVEDNCAVPVDHLDTKVVKVPETKRRARKASE